MRPTEKAGTERESTLATERRLAQAVPGHTERLRNSSGQETHVGAEEQRSRGAEGPRSREAETGGPPGEKRMEREWRQISLARVTRDPICQGPHASRVPVAQQQERKLSHPADAARADAAEPSAERLVTTSGRG